LCGLPSVHGVIDGTHIQISKPKTIFPKDYHYYKTGGYLIVVQAIIDFLKKNIDICVGLLGNINDYRVLHMFALYKHAQNEGLFDPNKGVDGFPLYLLGDKGYTLITWIMTPFKKEGEHSILDLLYNRKHKRGRPVIENVF
jgi:MoaA/NifB/PqqE/SkfB family radical SAM enzyme